MAEIKITNDNFEKEVMQSKEPVLVDFWATWCGPCQMLGPIIEDVAKEYDGKVKVGKVNVDDEQALAIKFGVFSIPTLLLFKNGEVVNKTVGLVSKEAIDAMLK